MRLLGVDEKGRPIVGDVLPPEATPRPDDPEPDDGPQPQSWGKIVFATVISLTTGLLIASGLSSCIRY